MEPAHSFVDQVTLIDNLSNSLILSTYTFHVPRPNAWDLSIILTTISEPNPDRPKAEMTQFRYARTLYHTMVAEFPGTAQSRAGKDISPPDIDFITGIRSEYKLKKGDLLEGGELKRKEAEIREQGRQKGIQEGREEYRKEIEQLQQQLGRLQRLKDCPTQPEPHTG